MRFDIQKFQIKCDYEASMYHMPRVVSAERFGNEPVDGWDTDAVESLLYIIQHLDRRIKKLEAMTDGKRKDDK